jgi:hypothetical protein
VIVKLPFAHGTGDGSVVSTRRRACRHAWACGHRCVCGVRAARGAGAGGGGGGAGAGGSASVSLRLLGISGSAFTLPLLAGFRMFSGTSSSESELS